MSAVDLAVEKVRLLPEEKAEALLAWLESQEPEPARTDYVARGDSVVGIARSYRKEPRPTADWMKDLREGEA